MKAPLKLRVAMTRDEEGASHDAAALELLSSENALSAQTWLGFRHASGPSALPEGPMRRLLMQDFPPTWSPTAPDARLWHWCGEQVCPGERLSPHLCGAITLLMMDVEPVYEEEFNAWYDTEHLPHIQMIPGIIVARRFRALVGAPRYLIAFSASEPEITQRADFRRYFGTPWTQRIWPKTKNHQRFLFTHRL